MEETAFHFDGSGYSVVHKSLRATSTSIVLLFKTLSPGGLLLYLASNNTVRRAHNVLVWSCLWRKYKTYSTPFLSRETSCPLSLWRDMSDWTLTWVQVSWPWPRTGNTIETRGTKSHCRGINAKVLRLLQRWESVFERVVSSSPFYGCVQGTCRSWLQTSRQRRRYWRRSLQERPQT